jgi:hypothetical protein
MSSGIALPDRDALMAHLHGLLGEEAAQIEKTVLHYLGNRIEAEVFLPLETCRDMGRMTRLEERIAGKMEGDPYFRAISLNCRIAPK